MDKKYYVWRDRHCNGVNPDWEEYTGPAFYEFIRRPENAGRRFIRLGNDVDRDAGIITIEATPEQYREWMREQRWKSDRRKDSRGVELISLDYTTEDPDGDEDQEERNPLYGGGAVDGLEDGVLDSLLEEQLISALRHLTAAERTLMELLYVKNMSFREAGKCLDMSCCTVMRRKNAALQKLRRYI